MPALPHMSGSRAIPRLLECIRREEPPVKVTPDYLSRHQFVDVPTIVSVLRAVGFTTKSNVPTKLWLDFRDAAIAPIALAEALRNSYSVLFDAYEHPDQQSDAALGKVLKIHTKYTNSHIQLTVATFRRFCEAADLDTLQAVEPTPAPAPREISTIELDAWMKHRSKIRSPTELHDYIGTSALPGTRHLTDALRCVSAELYSLAHVSAWNAFMADALVRLGVDGRPAVWTPDSQMLDMLVRRGLCSTAEHEWLVPLLQRRNECAHVTDFEPSRAQALWYIGAIIEHVESLAGTELPAGDGH